MKATLFSWGLFLLSLGVLQGAEVQVLNNQDFEESDLGWELWPANSQSRFALDPSMAYAGKQSLKVTAVRQQDRAIVNTTSTRFEAESLYRITVHVRRAPSVDARAVSFFINFRDRETGSISERAFPAQLSVTQDGEWERHSGLFAVPPGTGSWQFCLGVEHTLGDVWFDTIRVEDLGPPTEVTPDVWTNFTLAVEIGGGPATRFQRHREQGGPVYAAARRYNNLLLEAALAERELLDLERLAAYAGTLETTTPARTLFEQAEETLNAAYLAYARAFRNSSDQAWQQVEAAADALETALATLRAHCRAAQGALRGGFGTAPLPAHLGRQAREVPPLQPDGRMNRLLFGAWSPLAWSEFETPFEFEFHASAPGHPAVHEPDRLDFSTITAACDTMEQAGYRGTFGYLAFAIHDTVYAPQWLLDAHADDPDFRRTSWDGLSGRSSGTRHSLNPFHPAVRDYIRSYLGQYAAFCRQEPRILFYEVAQETYSDFNTEQGRRSSGYGAAATKAFREALRADYRDLAALNNHWHSDYASFDEIDPPADPHVEQRLEITPLVAAFERFRENAYIDYLKLIYESIKAADPERPVVARHSSLLADINGARIFETCDVLSYHNRAPRMQLMNLYLNSLNRFHGRGLGYMEDFWGCQQEQHRVHDERAQRRGLAKHVARTCIWGRTLQMKWYAYTGGSYIFRYNGNWFNPMYDCTTMRYAAPALAIAKRSMERFDWLLTHSTIPAARILVVQPSTTMRLQRPGTTVFEEILRLHGLLYPAGFHYELLPEEYVADGRVALGDFDLVVLPRATYLAAALQEDLATYVEAGGTLWVLGAPGTGDELGFAAGQLLQRLQAAAGRRRWPRNLPWTTTVNEAEQARGLSVRCGRGDAWLWNSLRGLNEAQRQALLASLQAAVARTAWDPAARLETVLRVSEQGEHVLFVLNPDVDQPVATELRLARPAAAVIDISLADGIPVPAVTSEQGTRIPICLAPGDCAVLYLPDYGAVGLPE